ncbi:MAG: hypothetical protein ACM36C_17865 [Acidobacteriota bacterium]
MIMFVRPLLVAVIIGTSLVIASTGTVSLALVAETTVAWSFVVLIQLLAALAIVATAPRRTMPTSRAVHAFFGLHVPWSAWMLAWAAWTWMTPADRPGWITWTALAPAAWTAVLVHRFCREVLGEGHRPALVRLCAHQAIVWSAFLLIGGAAVGLWPRVLWVIKR